MKVVDLGLESASPRQLQRMQKTRDPAGYLASAAAVLEACRANGVWAKVNVLLYAGETNDTIQDPAWLEAHADCIKGVSVGPVVACGPPRQAAPLIAAFESDGASAVDAQAAAETGVPAPHLSREIDADAAEETSLASGDVRTPHPGILRIRTYGSNHLQCRCEG